LFLCSKAKRDYLLWVSHRNTGRNQSRLFKKLSKRQIEKKEEIAMPYHKGKKKKKKKKGKKK